MIRYDPRYCKAGLLCRLPFPDFFAKSLLPVTVALVLTLVLSPPILAGVTFSANSPLDVHDDSPGDGVCRTAAATCTLRAAIDEANALALPAGQVEILLPAATYELSLAWTGDDANVSGDLDIRSNLELKGAGAGIYNLGVLTLTGVIVAGKTTASGNNAVLDPDGIMVDDASPGGPGGGIYNGVTLHLVDSAVASNSTGAGGSQTVDQYDLGRGTPQSGGVGGGIYTDFGSVLSLLRSSVSGNHTGGGGASYIYGNADPGDGGDGGGIYAFYATLEVTDSVISGNCFVADASNPDERIQSLGFNLIQNLEGCGFDAAAYDQLGGNPALGALSDNGGLTRTHKPGPSGVAINPRNRVPYNIPSREIGVFKRSRNLLHLFRRVADSRGKSPFSGMPLQN